MMMTDERALRQSMVDGQLRPFDVTNHAVLGAMLAIPRTEFVSAEFQSIAYSDAMLPVSPQSARRLLKPMVIGRMIQAVDIQPGERVLDIASGSGYTAALMTRLGAKVTALENDAPSVQIARAQSSRYGFTFIEGAIDRVPSGLGLFDVIVINGVVEVEPTALIAILADGGRLVTLFGSGPASVIRVIRKSGDDLGRARIASATGPVLKPFEKREEFSL